MEEVLGCQKFYLRVGSRVRVTEVVEDFPESKHFPFAIVTAIGKDLLTLDVNGDVRYAPASKLLLCRLVTDQLDAKGRILAPGQNIMVTVHGGNVTKNDVGGRGKILSLGRLRAMVSLKSDYEKVKPIPFDYLLIT